MNQIDTEARWYKSMFPGPTYPTLITDKLVSANGGTLIFTVICDSADGSGCGKWWLEYDGKAREFCPGCGRRKKNGNVIINDERTPSVARLYDPHVLVVGNEEDA